jgi:hypothetical protein
MARMFTYEEYKKHYAIRNSKFFPKPTNPNYDPKRVGARMAKRSLDILRKHLT